MLLQRLVEREGDQKRFPKADDIVTLSLKTWLHNSAKVETNFRDKPIGSAVDHIQFPLGRGLLLASCEREILKMSVGGQVLLILPPSLAYGEKGLKNSVPPNATIIVSIQLHNIGDES